VCALGGWRTNSTDSSVIESITNGTGLCLIGSISCGKFEIFFSADVVLLNVFMCT